MNEDKDEIEFSYEVFDRQLDNFCRMLSILVDAWEDYSPQELTFDIRSLCTKATRLCYMAEKDMVLQHNDIAKQRKEQNETHEVSISIIVMQKFTPLMAHIMEDMKKGKQIEGKRMKVAPLDMTRILPKLNEFFETDELGKGSTIDVNEVTKLQKELLRQVKPTHIPGVKPVERLWNLFQLYSMACYLMLHFRQLSHFTNLAMSEEQTTRLFEMSLQEYQEEPKGISDIDRYFTTLEYDNNGKQLSVSQLLEVRKTLKDEVPENLRLDFMKYIRDTQLLGAQLAHVNFTAQEYLKLVSATVKWHIIEQEIYDLEHPEGIPETLPNEVFYKVKRRQIHRHAESEGSDSQYVEICYPQEPLVLRMVCIESQLHASGQPELRSLCHPDDDSRMVWRHRRLSPFLGRQSPRLPPLFLRDRLSAMG